MPISEGSCEGLAKVPGWCLVVNTGQVLLLSPLLLLERKRVWGMVSQGHSICEIFLITCLFFSKKESEWMSRWWTARATPGQTWTCTRFARQGTILSVSGPRGTRDFSLNCGGDAKGTQMGSPAFSIICWPLLPWWDYLIVLFEGLRTKRMG